MAKKFAVYGVSTREESEREKKHRLVARKAASEGFVLLKNDDILPIQPQKIALFGGGSRMTVKGGAGSGDVQERHSVSIEEGLKNAGYEFNTLWMDRFTAEFAVEIEKWKENVNKAIKPYKNNPIFTMKMFIEIGNHPKPFPESIPVSDDELDDAETAVYVLSRQAGEGQDRKVEKGDYLLSDIETESLKKLSAHYKKLVLVLNCGSAIDLSILDETRIDAVLLYGQAGMEGGNALADILSGNISPSGKLTDTWAKRYEDYPCADTFSHMNGNTKFEEYKEGIFVGYRYFETFDVKPRYPFGYGLSYTTFDIVYKSAQLNGTKVTLTATVKNTGDFAGKEVVQLYAQKPGANSEKSSLVAFAKSKELKPNESEDITLEFDVKDLAIYGNGAFILTGGKYGLYLGNSVKENKVCAVINIEADIVVEKVHALVKKPLAFDELKADKKAIEYKDVPCFTVDNSDIKTLTHGKFVPEFSDKVQIVLKKLSAKQKTMLVTGGGYKMNGYVSVMGAAGRTNTNLLKKGIPNIIMADGPAGVNVVPNNACTKSGSPRYPDGLPEMWQWGWLKHVGWLVKGNPKKLIYSYRYMTAFPSGTLLAQSFNATLLEEVGKAVGREMKEAGVSVWLAPGMNIHRNPLCGRNFEYYSEDPLLSGKMAAAVTRGVQSNGGVGVSVKHFCCNNQEDNRMGVSENLSERALREIYLRGFRIAITESKPWTVMSSYNRVNGQYVCDSYDFLNNVLRNEWGFEGLVMSDWNATDDSEYHSVVNNGNDMIMPGVKKIQKVLFKAYKQGKLKKEALDISTARVLAMIYNSFTSEGF